jgi:alpha-galactosidase
VIAIDQDALGKQAERIAQNGQTETWLKPLADGGAAVGVINLGRQATQVTVKTADLKLQGNPGKARDLWRHQDVSFHDGSYSANVPSHGILMLRVSAGR